MPRFARLSLPKSRLLAAAGRLHAAETGFERSMVDLRRAALDHIDRQHILATALQATLRRMTSRSLISRDMIARGLARV